MRHATIAILLAGSPAAANPLELGASVGVHEDHQYQATSHSLGVFARVGVAPIVSAQLELAKLDNNAMGTTVHTASGLLVVDLGQGALAPIAFGGLGLDSTSDLNADRRFAHAELGAGLEYRALAGLTIGADVRIGARKLIDDRETGILTYYEPLTLSEGPYRSARVTVGARF